MIYNKKIKIEKIENKKEIKVIKKMIKYIDKNFEDIQIEGIQIVTKMPVPRKGIWWESVQTNKNSLIINKEIHIMYTMKLDDWENYFKLTELEEELGEMFSNYKFGFIRDG